MYTRPRYISDPWLYSTSVFYVSSCMSYKAEITETWLISYVFKFSVRAGQRVGVAHLLLSRDLNLQCHVGRQLHAVIGCCCQ